MSLHKMLRAAAGYQAPAPANTDPQFNYVSMLLHGDGSNGAQNNTFVDSSANNFTITRNGNTTQGSLSPYGNLWSNYFDSNTTYLSFPSNTASNLGSSNFTFECWYYPMHTTGDANLFWWNGDPSGNNGWAGLRLQFNTWNGRTVQLLCTESASTWNISVTTGTVYAPNTWYHVAVVRNGATVTAYLNGTSIASGNLSSASASLYGGTENLINNMVYPASTRNSGGRANISNVRLVKGTALYTSNFTPPTAPLTAITNTALLTCQSNRFIDNSANNFAITRNGDVRVTKESPFLPTAAYSTSVIGGSAYFDGTGDWLTVPSNSAFDQTGDFTFETWVRVDATVTGTFSNFGNVFSQETPNIFKFGFNKSRQFVVLEAGAGSPALTSTTTFAIGVWYHVAVVRSGMSTNNLKLYVNGVQEAQATKTNSVASANTTFIGREAWSGDPGTLTGALSDLRYVKGTAVYTSNFTPPTAPLTAITNTSLLLNFTNAGIFDNAAENVLETVGNAQISTSVKKYGTGSLSFDGNNDMLFMPYTPNFALKGTYTIEAWIYPTTTSGWRPIFTIEDVNTANFGSMIFAVNGTSLIIEIRPTTGGSITSITGGTVVANTWQHVAISVNATSARLFLNGTQVGSTTTLPDFSFNPMGVSVGRNANGWNATTECFLGYIDDLRITKGFARYTANFTPPTAAFPDQ